MTDVALFESTALGDRMNYAKALAASDLLPKQFRNAPANVLIALEYGSALGIAPMAAIQGLFIVEGKPTASAQLIGALVRNAGHRLRVSGDDSHATAVIVRKDDPEFEFVAEWTIERAQKAGLAGKGVWKQYPAAMLKARAITEVARDACPEVLSGVAYTAEELGHDTPPARTVDTSRLTPQRSHSVTVQQVGTVQLDTETGEIVSESDPDDDVSDAELDAEVLEIVPETLTPEPESDVSEQESGSETPLTADQSHRITVALKALELGKVDGLALYSEVCGRPVKATRELTRTEAGLVLAHLETMTGDE